MKKKYWLFDFIASLAFVFDVDWDKDFDDEPELFENRRIFVSKIESPEKTGISVKDAG